MIKIANLNINFKNEIIYNNFNYVLKKGEKLAITGKSGTGKSTLLNLLAGFIPDFKGVISINNIILNSDNIGKIRKLIAWLPQETSLNFDTVNELLFAPFNFVVNQENNPNKEKISKIFDKFELSEKLLTKKLNEISGGQRQRIILASCILLNKPLLLVDEPTSALDENIKRKVTDYIFSKKKMTIIAATHDKYWIENSDRIIHLGS